MKKLSAYENDQENILKAIYKAKTSKFESNRDKTIYEVKEVVSNKHKEIVDRYAEYLTNKISLENITNSCCNDIDNKALRHCYEKSTKALNILKKNIKESQAIEVRSICGYCGINSPGTFDHYLPLSIFPEFAVYGPNLIPCCGDCNSKKGAEWKDINNTRYFINLYYDEIPDIAIIEAIIKIEADSPKIEFKFIQNSRGFEYEKVKDREIVKYHYDKLELLNRFRDSCDSYISEIIKSLKCHKKFNKSEILEFLKDEYDGIVESYGINHWKSITLKGMINSGDFINFCTL